jgi:methionyl-tRNA synthetase
VGKDIFRFHALMWPAMLLALGMELPKTIFVHGYITSGGQKMSKTLGNVVDPFALTEKYGVDAVRYYLLREIAPVEDGDFTEEKFISRYNGDLASGLGNLVARVVTMAGKERTTGLAPEIINEVAPKYKTAIDNFRFNEALAIIWELIGFCDEYIEKERLWETKSKKVISDLLIILKNIAQLIEPFLPETSEKIIKQLKTRKSEPLFPRIK